MKRGLQRRINHALDRRVSWGLSWNGRTIPAFQIWAGLGLTLSIGAALALAPTRGLSAAWMAVAIAAAGAACFVLAMGYKVVTGEERLVFLHHAALAIGAAALVLRTAGQPVLPHVEILAVCFGLLLAIGRLGCLHAGCCHGRPHDWGVRYGERHVEEGFPAALEGVRLLPVQLLESLWSGLAALACLFGLALGASTGFTLACWLPLYSLGRFASEILRGDAARAWRGPLSEAQWICIALVGASLLGQVTVVLPSNSFSLIATVAVAVLLGPLASSRLRRRMQPFHPADLDAIAAAVRAEAGPGSIAVSTTPQGWRFSRGRIETPPGASCLHWAVSGFPGDRLVVLARLLLRLEGLPPDTPLQLDTKTPILHILAFPAEGRLP